MIRLTSAYFGMLAALAAKHGKKLEIAMPDGKTDIIGAEAGDVVMDDRQYYQLAREVGYRPPRTKGKSYQPNGNREMMRRQRRMK